MASRFPRGWTIGAFDRRLRVVVAANFIAVAARMSLVTFLGIWFVHRAGIDLSTVGLAFLCEHVLRGVAAPVFGAWSDRVGRKPLLVGSALLTAVVLPCFLLVDGPASLFVWSLALGLTGAVNMPVANALLLDLASPERRQSALALNYTAMSVAYTLGVMPAGYIAQQGYGFLAAAAALGYLVVAALYTVALRGVLPLERAPDRALFQGLRDPALLRFAALAFVFPLSMGLVVSATPLYAAGAGVGEGYIGLVLGGNSILVAALALPIAARIEAQGPARYLGIAALIVAAAHASYAAIPDVATALLVGTIVFSFAELVFSSAVPAAVARLAPPGRRGAYQGGWALVSSLSMGSALFFSGLLSSALGWRGTWLIYAAIVLAAGVLLHRARKG